MTGGGRRTLRHARAIAGVEIRRSVRSLRRETNKLVGIAINGLLLVAVSVGGGAGLVLFGGAALELAAEYPGAVRAGFAAVWLFVAAFTAFRTVTVVGAVDGAAGLLTTTSPRSVLGGLLLGEAGRHALAVGVPAAVLAAALSVGAGSVVAGPALLAALLSVWAGAFPLGYAAGQGVRHLSRTVPVVRRNRLKLSVAALVLYMGVIVRFGDVVLVLGDTPVGWYGDLALVVATGSGDPLRAGAALATTALLAPVGLAVADRVAVANWYGDPPVDDGADDAAGGGSLLDRLGTRLEGPVSRPTAAVLRAVWLRARRSPHKLTFALLPAFAFVGYLGPALGGGGLPDTLPVMISAYAAWGLGSAFTLNPVGDEGALLPITLTSGIGGHAYVRGRLLAAWVPGVLPTAFLVAAAGVLVGSEPASVVAAVCYAAVLTAAAPALSVGFGMAIPNFETRRVMMTREAVVPSVFAFFGYMLALGVVAAPGGLGLLFGVEPVALGLSPALLGLLATTVLALASSIPSYLYAVRRFEGYEVDR